MKVLTKPFLFIALLVANIGAGSQAYSAIGNVTAVDLADKTIKIVRDDKTKMTAAVSDATTIKRVPQGQTSLENAKAITLAEIKIDERIVVAGKLSDDNASMVARTIVVMISPKKE